eukprot:COSAG01_NODE_26149_length_722_cov_1.330658_1_plen_195_part_10
MAVTRVAMLTIYTNVSPPTARLSVWPCCCRVLRALTAAKCLGLARQRRCSGDARAPQRLRRQRLRRVGAAQPPAATASTAPETSGHLLWRTLNRTGEACSEYKAQHASQAGNRQAAARKWTVCSVGLCVLAVLLFPLLLFCSAVRCWLLCWAVLCWAVGCAAAAFSFTLTNPKTAIACRVYQTNTFLLSSKAQGA